MCEDEEDVKREGGRIRLPRWVVNKGIQSLSALFLSARHVNVPKSEVEWFYHCQGCC
jgi:hypothetical protein